MNLNRLLQGLTRSTDNRPNEDEDVEVENLEASETFTDPGGVTHDGEIGGGDGGGSVDDSGNVLGGSVTDPEFGEREDLTAVNPKASVTGGSGTAVGADAIAGESGAIALAHNANANVNSGIALGNNSTAHTALSIVIGDGADSTGMDSVSIGSSSATDGRLAIAIGPGTTATGERAIGIGDGAHAGAADAIAIGGPMPVSNGARIGGDQLVFGASSGLIPDSELDRGELAVDADESNSQFQLRYKDSNGTMQTGTISFD